MSLRYPSVLSPGCGTDSKRLEKSCKATAGGREHSTAQAQDRFSVVQARRQRFSNAKTLGNDFQNALLETGCMMLC